MKYLFGDWNKFSKKLDKYKKVSLFFDYDGTLTPIVSKPELALFPKKGKTFLKILQKNKRFILGIISGRSLKDVKKMVGIKGLIYAGNHGLEIESQSHKYLHPKVTASKENLKKIKSLLKKKLENIKGLLIEDKVCTLSIHYRLVNQKKIPFVKNVFTEVVRPYVLKRKVRVTLGKMVFEIRPGVEWHKGKAVLYLWGKRKKNLPIYIGDDVTDMDAFKVLKKIGISIYVGEPKKSIEADYYLKNTKEVEKFLMALSRKP